MKKNVNRTGARAVQGRGTPWDGRFSRATDPLFESFNRSLSFDVRLYGEDIANSLAWAHALRKAGVLSNAEYNRIRAGLSAVHKDIETGRARFTGADEDIHMAIERLLTLRIGPAGAKLHTGRSRNDQVATDTRMYVKKLARRITRDIAGLQEALVTRAQEHRGTVMPGYTHLQQAQPVSLAHYLLSLFFALERDAGRFAGAYASADILPLGSGALAGSGFAVDRALLGRELGFARISANSIDAVSDRDFVLEFLAASSILMAHLSRYAEDLITWSSAEFSFVEIADAYSTGSSMMPQKKNPDGLELVRGKTGRVFGNLVRLLTVMKGLPQAYGKDLQEDKEPLFDTGDTLSAVLPVMEGIIRTACFNTAAMRGALSDMLLATDIADYLTRKGMPFREAHKVVGAMTRHCIGRNKTFSQLSPSEFRIFSPLFAGDIKACLSFEHSLAQRNVTGGTGGRSVDRQISIARKLLREKRIRL